MLLVLGIVALAGWTWTGGLAYVLNALAGRALAARDNDAASRWLDLLHRSGRANAQSELLQARLDRHRQDYDSVRVHLQRAFELGCPRDQLEREQWLAVAQTGQIREAEQYLDALLRDQRGEGAEICEAYVSGYLAAYQTGKAQILLREWEKAYPDDPLPHVIRGGIESAALQWTAADRSYRRAVELEPGNGEAAVGLGDIMAAQKKYEEALDWYQRGQSGPKQQLTARLGMASSLQALGRLDEARQILTALDREYPSDARVLYASAQAELEARNDGRSRELLERAIKIDSHHSGIHSALSAVLRRAGEITAADFHSSRARELSAAKIRAEKLLQQISAEPDDTALRYELGKLQIDSGSELEGIMWLKSVLQIEPTHGEALRALQEYAGRRNAPPAD